MPLLRKLARFATLFAALVTGCAEMPQQTPADPVAVAIPAPRVGEFWEYFVRDAYTGAPRGLYRYEVARVDPQNTVVDVYRDGRRIDTYNYAPGWNPREMPLTNLQRFRYEPAFPAFEHPLEPGKTWYRVVRSTDPATGKSYRTHVRASVLGWERVHVPAGAFDAVRVVRQVYAGNAEFFNTQEEIMQTDWFAPAVNQVVRSEGSSSHTDTSRSGGPRRYLRVRGDWLVAELARHGMHAVKEGS